MSKMVDIPHYASESDVYDAVGILKEVIIRVSGMADSEITTLVNGYIKKAEKKVKGKLDIPHVVPRELHLGTGEDDEFDLGPEDEEFYIEEFPEDCVERILHCYFNRCRKKRPYPRDCDIFSDDKTLWDSTGYTQPSNEGTIKKAGDYAMKFDWSGAAGKARYPDVTNDEYIDINIDIYDWMFFRVRSDTNNVTLTVRLYTADASYVIATYIISKKGHWYKVMLDMDSDFSAGSGIVDWDGDNLYYMEFEVNKACTIYIDNINFNDGWCFTAPSGKLVVMWDNDNSGAGCDSPLEDGYPLYVTYTYDPFRVEVPENIAEAVAQYAGIKLIDFLIGIREGAIAFEFEADTLLPIPDKETLYARKGSLLARAKENLASYGYGFSGTVAR